MATTWIIDEDGRTAWDWHRPEHRIDILNADEFIADSLAIGDRIGADDRLWTD